MPTTHSGTISVSWLLPLGHLPFPIDRRAQLYDSYMSEIPISDAREHLAETIESARASREPVDLTRRGRRVAVLMDPESYDALVAAAEDATDLAELRLARDEDDYVPWDEVKRDLGLV